MRERIKWPARCLVFLGIVNLALALGSFGIGWLIFAHPNELRAALVDADIGVNEMMWAKHLLKAFFIGFPILQIALSAFVIFAGVQMLNLRMRWAGLAASLLVMLPCFSPCFSCVLGFLVGGWALVHLMDVDVKRAFAGDNGADAPRL